LGVSDITSQCPNKRAMILCDNREIEFENDDNYEKMSPLEDDSDNDVEYMVKGESLMVKRALKDGLEHWRENISHTRYHISNKVCRIITNKEIYVNITSNTPI